MASSQSCSAPHVLTDANTQQFDLQPGFADIGAYEFRGSSLDATPPTILVTTPSIIHDGGKTYVPLSQLEIAFSEPLNRIDATASAITTTAVNQPSLQAWWNPPRTHQLGPQRDGATRDTVVRELTRDRNELTKREAVFATVAQTRQRRLVGPHRDDQREGRRRDRLLDLGLADYLADKI